MSIKEHKLKYLSPKVQLVVIDEQGYLLNTCHTFIQISPDKGQTIFEMFPFLASIQDTLLQLPMGKELYFPRVEVTIKERDWIFDYIFYKDTIEGKTCLVWVIQDLTTQYGHLYNIQQERNEYIVKEEMAKIQIHALDLQKKLDYLNKIQTFKFLCFTKIVHDVQKPTVAISDLLSFFDEQVSPKMSKAYIRTLHTLTNQLHINLENLLQLPELHASPLKAAHKSFLLPQTVWSVIKIFDYTNSIRKQPIRFVIDPDVPRYVLGDALYLSQILYTALSLAVKYPTQNHARLAIDLDYMKADYCIIKFTIYEIGISQDKLQNMLHIFDTIEEIDSIPRDDILLALAIIKQLLSCQNGEILIKEEKDANKARLEFTLPYNTIQES